MSTPDHLDDPEELARYDGWSREVYADLLALRSGRLTREAFDARHTYTRAILVLDLTGFTENAMRRGEISGFLRILNAQMRCIPILRHSGAELIRAFADDLVALFEDPNAALDAALEVHRRTAVALQANAEGEADCCVGIGYGRVYAIGPNHAMGDEMNRTSKLGEDTARGGETLVTEGAYEALRGRPDVSFHRESKDDLLFPYFRAERKP